MPPVGADFDCAPIVIGNIQIDAALMFCGSHVDGALRPIELRSGFEEIKKQSDGPGTGHAGGSLVVLTPQPGSKATAANGPGFPVPVDHEICECHAADGVEELWFDIQIGEHIERRYACALVLSDPETVTNPVGSAARSRRVARSLRRVFLQSWRATLIGSMPACFHQARSSPTR